MANIPMIDRLQRIDRKVLYILLVIIATVPLFIPGTVIPTKTGPDTQALFIRLNQLDENSVVIIQSDWTVSSRGESQSALEALLRVLHARNAKFIIFSGADPQAPQVARNVVAQMNRNFKKEGLREFQPWTDYLDLGYFPQLESFALSMVNDVRKAWGVKTAVDPADGQRKTVFASPILRNVKKLGDMTLYVNVTASGTPKILIGRFGNPQVIPIAAMVTGVMGPEHQNYFAAKQLVGLSVGLRGVVELETMMANGINYEVGGKEAFVRVDSFRGSVPPVAEGKYYRGMSYFTSLHAAMTLLIVCVVLGNLGIISRKLKGKAR